ncbi:MAG: hypothetical protein WC845_03070 [Candidatus Staskawiczbacteria bacterium]|jgi:hypothetical protein
MFDFYKSILPGKNKGLPRKKFKEFLRRTPDLSKRLSPKDKVGLEKEVFPSFFGREISKKEVASGIENLRRQRVQTKNWDQREELQSKIKVLKKVKKKPWHV